MSEARESLKAENRIKRRFARFGGKENLKTRDPLVAELMLAQIDATLSVSHAIQEFNVQLGKEVMRQPSSFFGVEANHEARIREMERDTKSFRRNNWNTPPLESERSAEIAIGTLQAEVRGLYQRIDDLERHISSFSGSLFASSPPSTVASHQPWWAFWRGW